MPFKILRMEIPRTRIVYILGSKSFRFIFIFTESSFPSNEFLIIALGIILNMFFFIKNHIRYLQVWFSLLYNICCTELLLYFTMWSITTEHTSRIWSARLSLSSSLSAFRHHAAPSLSIIGAKEDWGSTTVPQSVQK